MDAHKILQSYLDDVAAAVMTGDFDSYESRIIMPFHLVTHTANIAVATQDALRAGFDDFRQTLRIQRVTDYIRLVDTAAQLDRDLISGRYITHLLAGGHRVLDPFQSQITLRLVSNIWRAASISNALANSRWPLLLPKVADTPKGSDQ